MARKTETMKIDGVEITVRELVVRELADIFSDLEAGVRLREGGKDGEALSVAALAEKWLPTCCQGLDREKMLDFAPSDIEEVWNVFRRLNHPTFRAAQLVGAADMLNAVRLVIQRGFFSSLEKSFSEQGGNGTIH